MQRWRRPQRRSRACWATADSDLKLTTVIEFRACGVGNSPAAGLLQAMRNEMAELYEGLDLDGPGMPTAGAAELGPPGRLFIVGFEDGAPICCGGVKRLLRREAHLNVARRFIG
jgi:hypothetical protein